MLSDILQSPICDVYFEGFKSTTYELQRCGWDISAQQDPDRRTVRLALRHRGSHMVAITDGADMSRWYHNSSHGGAVSFRVQAMSNSLRMVMVAVPHMATRWSPVDCFPQATASTCTEHNLRDLVPFKTVNHNAEQIVVAPESVTEVLNLLLRCQEPVAAARRLRERTRDAVQRASDIQAQIIVEAS